MSEAQQCVLELHRLADEDAECFAVALLHDGIVHAALSDLTPATELLSKAAAASGGEGECCVHAETCRHHPNLAVAVH